MLIPWLVSHAAEQPNVTNPIFIKLNQLTITFLLQCFYVGGTQQVIVEIMISIVHSNIHSYASK